MLLELMMNDGTMHIINADHIVDICPVKDVKNNEIHTQITTEDYAFLTHKPYDEIKKILLAAIEDNDFFVPYTFDPMPIVDKKK